MPEVGSHLKGIRTLLAAETPFDRLTGTVYIDAQATIQWLRLGVFEKVLDLLPIGDEYLPRFRLQDAASNEAVGVLAGKYQLATHDELREHLRKQPNLLVDGPLEATSPVGIRALALQHQLCIQAGEDPATPGKKHLGEAETLAMIEHHAPGSLFVTADTGAIAVARDIGKAHIVRPLAFAGGVVTTRDQVVEMWAFTCRARMCVFADAWNEACVEAFECTSPDSAAADGSPVSVDHTKAVHTLDWMQSDLRVLVSVLRSKGD